MLFKQELKILEDYDGLYSFFVEHEELFKKPRNGESDTNKHYYNYKMLEKNFEIEFPYGKCFPISQFLFYYLGGYESDYQLNCIRQIPIKINDYSFFTSHWYVSNKKDGTIIDLTKIQFEKIINIEELYEKGRKANYGWPYFKKGGKRYEKVVPSRDVMKLYEEFRKVKKSDKLEYYYKEFKNETK